MPTEETPANHPKIRFNQPSPLGGGESTKPDKSSTGNGIEFEHDDSEPIEIAQTTGNAGAGDSGNGGESKIRAFGQTKRHVDNWDRTPNLTGQGATHVRTFHCKLTGDSLEYMDQTVNEWLDKHSEYEVKFTSVSIGEFTGKLKEPHLICQVWV